jgi:glutamate-5-semialdehyde dehydrogenase
MTLINTFKKVQAASRGLALLSESILNKVLRDLADAAEEQAETLVLENKKDLDRMADTDPKYDRLKLTTARIKDIANDLRNVAGLPSPLGITLEERTLNNGMKLKKISVPLGVIGIIYEARPNVTFDVFALCLKSGNACLLKGGSDAEFSNTWIASLIRSILQKNNVDPDIITLLPSDRAATTEMLNAVGYVDIIIPRGSQNLINYVRDNAKVPVIETGAGIVHVYFDDSGDLKKGSDIVFNSKTRRVSVCNALDCLVVHANRLKDLPSLAERLASKNVTLYADDKAYQALDGKYPSPLLQHASEEHFGTEFLDYKMSIKTANDLTDALRHITEYSSKHSEAVVAEDEAVIDTFMKTIDAAAVYANASTAFTDGAQFGLGAEIGISTQKLHARGPMALREMTSYKWLIRGDGNVRG